MKTQTSVAALPPKDPAWRAGKHRHAAAAAASALLLSMALAGCGQKGPLTLPAAPAADTSASAPAR